jgi:hypothetical protein
MSKIALSGNASGTGTFTIASPNSNSDRTLNLPDAGGTVFVSGQALSATTGTFTGLVNISAAGAGQIQFPATQNASASANTLDDYEEGTWTPTLTAGAGCSNLSSNNCRYTKIGNVVICTGQITGDSGGGTINFSMTGPFPMAAIADVGQIGTLAIYPYAGTYKQSGYVIDNSGSEATSMFAECYAGSSFTGGTFRFSLSYQTSA